MKAVRPYTLKGKLLCSIIQGLAFLLHLFYRKKWLRPRVFEENPRTMKFKDILYFAYKYYYRSPLLASNVETELHFSEKLDQSNSISEVLVTVSLGGDLMPYASIQKRYTEALWDAIGEDFFSSDIVFANLETPFVQDRVSSHVPEVMLYDMHFNTDAETFSIFNGNGKYKGYNVLSVANNHTMDQDAEGVDNTIAFLQAKGIRTVGAKCNEMDPDFALVEVNGIKTAFIAFTYSLNQFELEDSINWKVNVLPLNTKECSIDRIRRHTLQCREAGAEIVICSLHCGNAYQVFPSEVTVKLFERVFSECGVDIIAGTHPHNLQPWKKYAFKDPFTGKPKHGFAIYSLGDFIAYDIYTWSHLNAYVVLEIGRNSAGEVVFRPNVKPIVMLRTKKQLRLEYAEKVFKQPTLSNEMLDMKVLYDTCMSLSDA